MAIRKVLVVFVHGWSVSNTDTYGELPGRLRKEATAQGIQLEVAEIYLGRYISFHDEVRISDISRAFRTAVQDELSGSLQDGTRFVCITHSTGGPVLRDWWHRYYQTVLQSGVCPMSHLVMLAPANYGSALAQLGKGRISRMKFWLGGVEPGQGVLDWLELGSAESWKLNTDWIFSDGSQIGPKGVFPFVLTGEYIDRAFYDNLNTYTGELGSDGVVRVAAANLCGTYLRLDQETPQPGKKVGVVADKLHVGEFRQAPCTALRLIAGKSHSGKNMGIMRSVKEAPTDQSSQDTVNSILACLQVETEKQYQDLCTRFEAESQTIQQQELLEVEIHFLRSATYFFHDRYSMVIFRVQDEEGHPVLDFDLILTAGPNADPNHLPVGFFADKQRNSINPETITYFFNYDVMKGVSEVTDDCGKVVRDAAQGAEMLGFRIVARPDSGFVHYLPCEIQASPEVLEKVLQPNCTTLVDIRLQRIVHKTVFQLEKVTGETKPKKFENTKPGEDIA
jgi:hypothetical protein